MSQKLINIRVEVGRDVDSELDRWAEKEGRSKRRHLAILARQLSEMYAEKREELVRLGLVSPAAA